MPVPTRLRQVFRAALGLALAVAASATQAATIGFDPGSASPLPGESFVVDVVVSDLSGEIVSAYDLDIVFDASVLAVDFVSQSNALGDPTLLQAFLDASSAPGLVDIAGVSLLSDATLAGLQGGDAVTLATIGFTATSGGATTLDFAFDATNDVKGRAAAILELDVSPGRVGSAPPPIPEPTAALQFAAGVLVAAWATRGRGLRRSHPS